VQVGLVELSVVLLALLDAPADLLVVLLDCLAELMVVMVVELLIDLLKCAVQQERLAGLVH